MRRALGEVREAARSISFWHWVFLLLAAAGTFSVVSYSVSNAAGACYAGTVHGRACFRGYFSNTEDKGGDSVLPEISGGLAIPNSVNTADELYNLLRAAYDSGNAQRRTGAAFIYNTMMGNRAPGTGRGVSNAQWLDLRNRLRSLDAAGKINWTGNVSAGINSYWQGTDEGFDPDGTTNDDAFYYNYKNEPGITIRDYNNNVVYEIIRRCANPIGDSSGIPPALEYELTPHIDNVTPDEVEPGSTISVTSSVDNNGNTQSDVTAWEITKMTVAPGKKAPHEDDPATVASAAPCESGGGAASGNYFQNADATCENVAKGSGRFNVGSPSSNLKPSVSGIEVDDLPPGTRLCFALSVKPFSRVDTRWAHSEPVCTIIGKKPKVQVWGGDLYARGRVETSTTTKKDGGSQRTYGSWVEYGLLVAGTNVGMASGAALNNGSTGTIAERNQLTFANVSPSGATNLGNYTLPPASGLASQFIGNPSSGAPASNLGSLGSGTYTTGSFTITASDIGQEGPNGKTIVVVASGTVSITGDIVYKGPGGDTFTEGRQIPQVVIIANRINIAGNVGRVDAWLITTGANGFINTCSDVALTAPLTIDICSNALKINGPIETSHLYLRRTAGSGSGGASGDPAEILNLRADAYIWGSNQAMQSGKAQTVYSTELPPRF